MRVLGGNAVYAAAGAAIWSDSVGIVARVGSNYPREWLDEIAGAGFDTRGIKVLPEPQDTRTFYAYLSQERRVDTNPAAHFLRVGIPLPKRLVDYVSSTEGQQSRDSFGPLTIRPQDVQEAHGNPEAAHIAPGDYLTHSLMPMRLRELGVTSVMVDPSIRYMEPDYRSQVSELLKGLQVFLPSEAEARSFFQPRPPDLWEMAESLSEYGCPIVVIKRGAGGQYLWDHEAKRRWHIPAYPSRVVDVTGAGDSYCGGFMVGLRETGDVLEAGLRGSVSASIAIEGAGALYTLGAAPGLPEARLEALRGGASLI